MTSDVRWRMALGLAAVAMLTAATPARAQRTGDGFLFGTPSSSFVLRGGLDQALAGGDLLTFVRDSLTLNRGSFRALSFTGEINARLGPRTDLVFAATWSGSRSGSEYRYWVDNNNLPIQQTTSLQRVPLTVGLRQYLAPVGQSVGRLAWIPSKVAPFIGGGAGVMWYRFHQDGDFIDDSLNVFRDAFTTSDWAFTAYAEAGADVSLGASLYLTGAARYTWARAKPHSDFSGWDRIDLSGVALSVGVGVRY